MWLIIDAGNSRIKAALFGDDRSPIRVASIPTNCGREELRSQLIALADGAQVDRAGIAAVSSTPFLGELIDELAPGVTPLRVNAGLKLPLRNAYETPATLGTDRIASASAAWMHYGKVSQRPTVSVDFGTAVTYEVITRDGTFIGGAIAPGPRLQLESLNRGTAHLPLLEDIESKSPIGASTRAAIEAGVMYGFVDGVAGMLARIEYQLGESPVVILTGGWSEQVSPLLDVDHKVDRHLVVKGIRIIMELNP